MITQLSDLTHASRDGRETLCGKAVHLALRDSSYGKDAPRMVYYDTFTKQFLAIPTCRTCREQIQKEEYTMSKQPQTKSI